MLRTKSVSSDIDLDDGLRLLVTRFRERGLPKDRYDVWMANLGLSEALPGVATWSCCAAARRTNRTVTARCSRTSSSRGGCGRRTHAGGSASATSSIIARVPP